MTIIALEPQVQKTVGSVAGHCPFQQTLCREIPTNTMGDTGGGLFKSMKAKLGMNSTKQKGQHHHDGLSTKHVGVTDVDETHGHPGQKEGRRDPRKHNLETLSKSREMMMAAYRGTSLQHLLSRSLVL